MRIKLILRLVLAVVFATLAVIFSELIPPVDGFQQPLLRVLLTIASAGIGFLVFPDVATKVSSLSVTSFNFVVNRLASEILNQLLKRPKDSFHIPFITQSPQISGVSLQKPIILDTSAIIDGRIVDVAKVGFLYGTVLVPQFVLTELQQVADSSDFLKRTRARRGFELIEELKKVKGVRVEVWDKDITGKAVDTKLVQLAKSLNGKIVTTDFNLNKLASISNITVLNVNDLANAVKTIAIPGEKIEVKVLHLGKDPTQGVGYLPDGTMLIVQNGAEAVGQTLQVEVTKNLQSAAGKMIFAKAAN